jgi:glycosyltransferase involved in cell wall biosynthesis
VVCLGGAWPQPAVAALFRAADAFVTADAADEYGLQLAQAAATGLVIVAPAGGAPFEELLDESFALIVPAEVIGARAGPCGYALRVERAELARAMLRAATEPELRARAAVEGPRHARARLGIERSVDVLLGILQDDMWEDD